MTKSVAMMNTNISGYFFLKTALTLNVKDISLIKQIKQCFGLLRKIRELNLPIEIQIELYDKTIKPIFLYSCELCGIGNLDIIERVQLKFLKQILHLKKINSVIYGLQGIGIFQLVIEIKSRIISFWTKLVKGMENHKLSSIIYEVLNSLHRRDKCKAIWIETVKEILESNGYSNIYMSPKIANANWIILSLKRRLKDSYYS